MWPEVLDYLCCPRDGHFPLSSHPEHRSDNEEIITGHLSCETCGSSYPIQDGIVSMFEQGPDVSGEHQAMQLREMEARDRGSDRYEEGFSRKSNEVELNAILRVAGLRKEHSVLEAGCGTGRLGRTLATLCDFYLGIDFSFESLRLFRQRSGAARVHLIQADFARLPVKAAVFTHSFSFQVLEHLPSESERLRAFHNLAKVIHEGGTVITTVYNFSLLKRLRGHERDGFHSGVIFYHNFTCEELMALARQASLVPEQCFGLHTPAYKLSSSLDRVLQSLGAGELLGHLLLLKSVKQKTFVRGSVNEH